MPDGRRDREEWLDESAPIASGTVLRYLLYDIDRIISRTVSYGAVTAILAAVFVETILVSQPVLASFFSGNSVAVAESGLVVAGSATLRPGSTALWVRDVPRRVEP